MADHTQLERDLGVLLRDRARLAPDLRAPASAGRATDVARRARRRRLTNSVTVAATLLLLVAGGAAAIRSGGGNQVMPPPAVPITPHHNGVLVSYGSEGIERLGVDGSKPSPFLAEGGTVGSVWGMKWSPDGSRLAFLAGRWSPNGGRDSVSLYVADADGTHLQQLTRCPGKFACGVGFRSGLSWSPDGRSIAVASGQLYVVDVGDGARRQLPAGHLVQAPAWSPDGSLIAVGRRGQVLVVAADTGKDDASAQRTLADLGNGSDKGSRGSSGGIGVDSIDWSPDASRLVVSATDGVHIVDAAGTRTFKVVSQKVGEGPAAAIWSPDGTRIAYFTTPRNSDGFTAQLRLLNPDTRQDRALWTAPCCTSDWYPPAWSPDGSRIALSIEILGHPDRTGLFLVPSDGANPPVRITTVRADPTWQPLP